MTPLQRKVPGLVRDFVGTENSCILSSSPRERESERKREKGGGGGDEDISLIAPLLVRRVRAVFL